MDPNANLAEQEALLDDALRRNVPLNAWSNVRLGELRIALLDWLNAGGFEPDWDKAPQARKYYGTLGNCYIAKG